MTAAGSPTGPSSGKTEGGPAAGIGVVELAKSYGHVTALSSVTMAARMGEIVAIVGDNGAGKSTLVKLMSGAARPDRGRIFVHGQPCDFHSPVAARAAGVATVYQDLAVVDVLDVATNMFIGQIPTRARFVVDRKRMERDAEKVLRDLNIRVGSVRTSMGMLSGGQRQIIAVARAIGAGSSIVILDEPTAALGVRESAQTLDLMRGLRAQGKAVIVVSHDIGAVFDVADRIVVVRLGKVAGVRRTDQTTREEVVRLITGAQPADTAEVHGPVEASA